MIQEARDLHAVLARYRNFEECLLSSISSANHLTSIRMTFDYIWDDDDPSGTGLAEPSRNVVIDFWMVRHFQFDNRIPPSVMSEPERASWGLTEVAAVRLANSAEVLAPYHAEGASALHHVAIVWEGATRIDVVCCGLSISEKQTPAEA